MRHVVSNKKLVVSLLTMGAVAIAGTSFAYETTETATLDIGQALSISKTSDLNFGTLNKPTSGTAIFEFDPTGGSLTASITGGTDADWDQTTGTAGHYTLNGEGDQPVTVTLAATDSTADNVTFDEFWINGPNSTSINGNLSGGKLELYIGGKVTVTDLADPAGTFQQTYTITANYQ